MLVLLPPSEGKATRARGRSLDLAALTLPELTGPRERVLAELSAVSARDDAPDVLGVGAGVAAEVARNTRLRSAPTLPAGQLYTGVLYDALDLPTLDAASRRRASRRVLVSSALFGALRLTDRVPPYRLAMGVTLPGTGPLARFWRPHLAPVLPALVGRGLVVDCRSSGYAASWPVPAELADRWLVVRVPGATHRAKHTRGLVARALVSEPADPQQPTRLADRLR
ncbi:YaaA family protein, partial [Ornithinicoccus halotolerans]|uniref:YaaA family protein n=1 Tax=Ornithinicoccus halotolerans TaxID=1748220 RepID=UPI001297FAC3